MADELKYGIIERFRYGSIVRLSDPRRPNLLYCRRIGSKNIYRTLLSPDLDDQAYDRVLDYEKMQDTEYLQAKESRPIPKTFGDVFAEYEIHMKHNNAPATYYSKMCIYGRMLPKLKHELLEYLIPSRCERILNDLQGIFKFGNNTWNHYADAGSSVMHFAMNQEYTVKNPFSRNRLPRRKFESTIKEIYTRQEKNKILNKAKGWIKILAILGFGMGMRRNEMLILKKEYFTFFSDKDGSLKGDLIFNAPKTNRKEIIIIPQNVLGPLYSYVKTIKSGWLFPSRVNGKGHIKFPLREWKKLLIDLGIPDKSIHAMRHTFVTHAREDGIPDSVIRYYTGHKSGRIYEGYSHVGRDRYVIERYMDKK